MGRSLPVIDLNWQCQRSGDCCRTTPTVTMTWAERNALESVANGRRLRWSAGERPELTNLLAEPCPFLDVEGDHTRCGAYEVRPLNCRRFQCWRPDVDTEAFVPAEQPFGCENFKVRYAYSKGVRDRAKHHQDTAMQTWGKHMGWAQLAEGFHL